MKNTIKTQEQSNTQNWLGHPKGLFYLFFAELWERFSFYGMRALLVLYMTKQLLFSDTMSFGVYAAYMSLVYFTPVIGGILADQFLGYRKSILLGGLFMAAGHFFLTIETPFFFYTSLSLIIVGNGFFKPNISTFVGKLYAENDLRRDSGFTIFYMGINIGGAAAPLLCAWLAELYGWHYGFILAGIGMLGGLLFFYRGMQLDVFGQEGLIPDPDNYHQKIAFLHKGQWILLGALLSIPLFALIVRFNQYEHYLIWISVFVISAVLIKIYQSVDKIEKNRLIVIVYYTVLMTLFWAIFEQAGSSLTLFADRNVHLIGMNAAQTNSINSVFIILLAIPFSWLWSYLNRSGNNPHSGIKAGLGILLLGIGFIIFGMSARYADELAQTPMSFLILGYLILTIGELCISPIGLSKMTELSPAKHLAFIMGVFFTSSFYGHFFAGKIAKLTSLSADETSFFATDFWEPIISAITGLRWESVIQQGETIQQLYSYVSIYAGFGVAVVIVGILALLISPWIEKMMEGVK